ncbi:MAG: vanadium-dependent haloperoxidase [Ferruginibacter sp.]
MILLLVITFSACQKEASLTPAVDPVFQAHSIQTNGHLKQTKTYSSEVAVAWLDQQLKMFKIPFAFGAVPPTDRAFAYAGIALYEAVMPGMPSYQSLGGQLNGFPTSSNPLPVTTPGMAYNWAASANAALAQINRRLFTGAAAQTSINNLEASLQNQIAVNTDPQVMLRSVEYGQATANAVWAWAQGDGTSLIAMQSPYVIPVGFGNWVNTSPGSPANPYHNLRRQMVPGSRVGAAAPGLPFQFSTSNGSAYYNMANEVSQILQHLTPEQRNIALYQREGGVVNGGSYGGGASLAGQMAAVITKANATLDVAAEIYAKVGIGSWESLTLTFIQKYQFLVMRPITYIQANIDPGFTTLFATPPYPEYPAGHPTNGGMLATMLTSVLGNNFSFDVDYYGASNWGANALPARHYNSFEELAQEMAIARVYAGIHYKPAVFDGTILGKKVAGNILNNIHFKK